ncbi:hypothetical protein BST61_g9935 [Cercospora zeina]
MSFALAKSQFGRMPGSRRLLLQSRCLSTGQTVPLIIDGKDVITDKTFDVVSPVQNAKSNECSSASLEHVKAAVEGAQKAFGKWRTTKPQERRDLFLRAASIMEKRKAELSQIIHEEIGADQVYQNFIIGLGVEGLKDTAGRISGACTGSVPDVIQEGMRGMILKRPYGVNLGIAPWNAPYHLGLRSFAFALATGNTAILKGPEFSPRCYYALADIFREAGLPDGALQLLFHRPADAAQITEALIAHPLVKKINFTGSSNVGSIVAASAGKHLKPCLMELGGKANAFVLKDANLETAAKECAMGAFLNAGQICMSTERILVHSSVAEEFKKILGQTVNKIFGAADTTPILVTEASAKRNKALVSNALSKGASQLQLFTNEIRNQPDTRMRPIVLTDVKETMDLYRGESFGPSVSLYTFDDLDKAVDLANDTDYGLSAAIFTENLNAGFKLAERLDSGAVHINSMTVHDEFALPHGGVKKSGWGRFNGYQGLDEFLYCKTVTWME